MPNTVASQPVNLIIFIVTLMAAIIWASPAVALQTTSGFFSVVSVAVPPTSLSLIGKVFPDLGTNSGSAAEALDIENALNGKMTAKHNPITLTRFINDSVLSLFLEGD
jgi:hypothetical protein